jgi:hypothetical protein
MAYTPGSGSTLKVTISAALTAIAQLESFGPITRTRARIDVTGLADTFEVIKGGIKRGEIVAFSAWLDPANATHAFMQTSYASTVNETWQVLSADTGAATIDFTGFLSKLEYWGEVNVDQYVKISGEITLTSDITIIP